MGSEFNIANGFYEPMTHKIYSLPIYLSSYILGIHERYISLKKLHQLNTIISIVYTMTLSVTASEQSEYGGLASVTLKR